MAKLLQLRTFSDARGNLTVIEKELPYPVKRSYYIYDVPDGVVRGGHRHKETTQVLICLSGSCVVDCQESSGRWQEYCLDSREKVLILEPPDYHTMRAFSKGAVLLILSSHPYDVNDYIDSGYPNQ